MANKLHWHDIKLKGRELFKMGTFNFQAYLKVAANRIIKMCHVFDYAKCIEKMTNFDCAGNENSAWKEGPFLFTLYEKQPKLTYDIPYCFQHSFICADITGKYWEGNPDDYPKNESEKLLSGLSIVYQFSVLEAYDFWCYENELKSGAIYTIDTDKFSLIDIRDKGLGRLVSGRIENLKNEYERKSVKKRAISWSKLGINPLTDEILEMYEKISLRRNEIVHEMEYQEPDIREAIEYFNKCIYIAKQIGISFNDSDAINHTYTEITIHRK